MSERCECFRDKMELVKNKVSESLPKGIEGFTARWDNEVWIVNGEDRCSVNPKVNYEYFLPKKGGGFRLNKTKKEVSLLATHCCFCGRKYETKSK